MSMQIQQNVSKQINDYEWKNWRGRQNWQGDDNWFDGNTWLITNDAISHYSTKQTARAAITSRARNTFGWQRVRTQIVDDGFMMQCYNGPQRTSHYSNKSFGHHKK